jgi:asparagine synthetase B (glutamine-hydrolysing)
MILGLVRAAPSPQPGWFAALQLGVSEALAGGSVYLGASATASSYRGGGLAVVAEGGPGPGHAEVLAETIADAYRRFGSACVGRLPGRFRFILHDSSAEQVFAASSTAPPWPLAYWSDSGTTLVGSSLLSLLRCENAPRTLDESYLVHLVLGLSTMADGATAVRGIRRLCVGEALVVDAGGCARVSQVDRLTPREVRIGGRRASNAFLDELGSAMRVATAEGPSVISLSGGLDSASLAAAGLRASPNVEALSFVAPSLARAAEIDGLQAMERASPGLHVTRIDASDTTDLPDLGPELRDDPPLVPIALLPARIKLWSMARSAGFRTVLEGEGGDELFSMLPTPLDALRGGRVRDVVRHVLGSPGRRERVEYGLWLPLLPDAIRRAWIARRQPVDALLPAFLAWGASGHPVVRQALDQYLGGLVHRPFAERLTEWLSAPMVVGAALSRRHLAGVFGIELEWPMLARGVLELVLGLHAAGAIRGGPDRHFQREALEGLVPDEVRRPAKNIGLYRAFIPRVLTSPRSRQALRDPRVRARVAHLVRFERVDAMIDGLAAGRSLGPAALWHLECLVSFAEWYGRASREHGVD